MHNNEIPKQIIKGTRPASGIPPHNNIAWLKKHHAAYQGQWIALHDGNLLGASEDGVELYKTLKNEGKLNVAVFINLNLDG